MTQLLLDLGEPPAPTFDNFVVGKNAELVFVLRKMCAARLVEPAHRLLYLWGEKGSGRSHLLRAASGSTGGLHLCGATIEEALPHHGDYPVMRDRALIIAIDDLETASAAAQETLFHTINAIRDEPAFGLIIAGNAPPRALRLAADREDLRSRLGWGLVFEVERLDDSEKETALAWHAAERGLALTSEVRHHLLTHFSRDMPALMRLVDALDRYALERQRVLTLPLIREFSQQSLRLSDRLDDAA